MLGHGAGIGYTGPGPRIGPTDNFSLVTGSVWPFWLPTPTAVERVRLHRCVCLFVCLFFQTISQKPMQLGQPNVTYKCATMIPGNPFILGSKGKRSRSHCPCRYSDWTQYWRWLRTWAMVGFPRACFLQCCECGAFFWFGCGRFRLRMINELNSD